MGLDPLIVISYMLLPLFLYFIASTFSHAWFFFFFFFFCLFYSLLFALILLCFISVVRFAILASPSGLRWLRYLVNPTFHVEDWDSACHAGAIGMTVAR